MAVLGVYYEGQFSHNKMTGKGLMLFEDETSYEGSFADAGVFNGHGVLTYEHGDRLEGSFHGNYTDGMKFNGTVYKVSDVDFEIYVLLSYTFFAVTLMDCNQLIIELLYEEYSRFMTVVLLVLL